MCVVNPKQDNASTTDGAKAHHRPENRCLAETNRYTCHAVQIATRALPRVPGVGITVEASCDTGVNCGSAFGSMVGGILLSSGEEDRVGIEVGGEVCAAGVWRIVTGEGVFRSEGGWCRWQG